MSRPCSNCGADLDVCKHCDLYNGIFVEIPENASNGEMIQTLFPNIQLLSDDDYGRITNMIFVKIEGNESHCYKYDWWKSLYKRRETE